MEYIGYQPYHMPNFPILNERGIKLNGNGSTTIQKSNQMRMMFLITLNLLLALLFLGTFIGLLQSFSLNCNFVCQHNEFIFSRSSARQVLISL